MCSCLRHFNSGWGAWGTWPCEPNDPPPPPALHPAGCEHAGPQAHLCLVRAQRPAPTRGARRSPAPQHAQRGVPPAAAGAAVRVDELVFHDGGGAPIMGDGDAPVWARDARRPLRRRRWTSSDGGGEGGGGGGGRALRRGRGRWRGSGWGSGPPPALMRRRRCSDHLLWPSVLRSRSEAVH